jgi:hypothetical protein
LERHDYEIFWTLLGEKQLIGGGDLRENYIGRLEISGAYGVDPTRKIIGNLNTKFTS